MGALSLSSRKIALGIASAILRFVALTLSITQRSSADWRARSASVARSSAFLSFTRRSSSSASEAPPALLPPVTGIPPCPLSYEACIQSSARVMTVAFVMSSRRAKSSIKAMYSSGRRKFACLTFELNSNPPNGSLRGYVGDFPCGQRTRPLKSDFADVIHELYIPVEPYKFYSTIVAYI